MRVLIVEDDESTSRLLARCLRELAFAVDTAGNGREALEHVDKADYDLILLDLALPDVDGASVLGSIRARQIHSPTLVVSGRSSVADKVRLLDSGADDYMVKPFAIDELVARVGALTRRPAVQQPNELRVGDLRVDITARRAYRGDAELLLTIKEYTILAYLTRKAGNVVSRSELAGHAWNRDFDEASNSIDVLMSRLRKKVDGGRGSKLIHTVRGSGYLVGLRNG